MKFYKKINLLGKYKKLMVGYAKEDKIKFAGASGGIVTSILINAIEKGLIDSAMVVGMGEKQPWRPKVKLAKTKKEILSAAGSKYTLIPINKILDAINKEKGRLAVVGLPCHVRVIRNLQKKGKYKNMKFIIGLFCGYNMDYDATEFLLKKLKINKQDIKELKYRGGEYPGGFYVSLKNGKEIKLPKHYYDFLNLMFVPEGCLNCKDYMNEEADISVGDAWGYENRSLIFVRTAKGKELLKIGNVETQEISEKEVFKMHGHNIKHKKIGDSVVRIVIRKSLKKFGKYFPLKLLGSLAKTRRKAIEK